MHEEQKKKQWVTVVRVTEETPIHAYEEIVKVFSDSDKATAWVEGEIDRLVKEYELDREKDVDEWCVRLAEDYSHQVWYSFEEIQIDEKCDGIPSRLPRQAGM